MNATATSNRYTDWLTVLFLVLAKVRREGLMSIESDVDNPEGDRSIFASLPQTLEQPYLEFTTDILRMMVSGNLNSVEMEVLANHAIGGYTKAGAADPDLLQTIWLTLWSSLCGYAPQVAVEFGRHAVPLPHKPSFSALQEQVKEAKRLQFDRAQTDKITLDEAIDRFVASLG